MPSVELLLLACLVLGVFLYAVVRLTRTRTVSEEPLGSLEILRSIEIDAPQIAVWDFCVRPESSTLTEDGCIAGETVPGTPRGRVGERQTFTYEIEGSRTTRTIQVVHLIPRVEATTVAVDHPAPRLRGRTTTRVSSAAGGRTLLTLIQGYTVKEEALDSLPDAFVDGHLAWMDDYLRRVKEHVEARRGYDGGDPGVLR